HEARDDSKRHTYRHYLGRTLSPESAAGLQWGPAYRGFHKVAVAEMVRVARAFVWVNMSNHIRKGVEVDVVGWWRDLLAEYGTVETVAIATPRQRHGANGALRVDSEALIICTLFGRPC